MRPHVSAFKSERVSFHTTILVNLTLVRECETLPDSRRSESVMSMQPFLDIFSIKNQTQTKDKIGENCANFFKNTLSEQFSKRFAIN